MTRPWRNLLCAVLLSLIGSVAARGQPGGQARGLVAPTTQPADLTTPKGTIAAMFAATASADGAALKRTFLADTTPASELASGYTDLVVAARRLRDASQAAFADAPTNPANVRDGTTPGSPPPEQAQQLAQADVRIDGDRATVKIPNRQTLVHLKKIGGDWLIDLSDFASANPRELAEQAEVDHSLAAAMQEATDEIKAGKYASAQEAEAAVQQKIHAVIGKQLKTLTTAPPASAPATMQAEEK